MRTDLTRRGLLLLSVAALGATALPASALSTSQAEALIDKVVARINTVINSGKSEQAMYGDFEDIFVQYGDLKFIAFKTLGPPARSASATQMRAYTRAFQGYMARKYGKRFREFNGGQIIVRQARAVKSYFEVKTTAILQGLAPFDVSFFVSDKSGRDLFFDMRIAGVSLVNAEKEEIGALWDRNGRNIDRLTDVLKTLG